MPLNARNIAQQILSGVKIIKQCRMAGNWNLTERKTSYLWQVVLIIFALIYYVLVHGWEYINTKPIKM